MAEPPPRDLADVRRALEAWHAARPADDPAHDVHHVRRVWALCARIADEMGVLTAPGARVPLLCAAYLHDLVNPPKDSPDRARASTLSADAALPVLARIVDLTESERARVHHAIRAHAWSAGIACESAKAEILQDADRMEALGAIGLARCFAVAGALGRDLFDPADPLAENRPPDDTRWAVDHFHTKLLRLPARMNTAPGRRIAAERARVLIRYLEDLRAELG